MDKSEQYIKMCEKAEEIQELKTYEYFDYYVDPKTNHSYRLDRTGWDSGRNTAPLSYAENYGFVWLPRQDQLQKMLDYRNNIELMHSLYKWFCTSAFIPFSWEQIWLRFVMKEKYGKVWDGKKWED